MVVVAADANVTVTEVIAATVVIGVVATKAASAVVDNRIVADGRVVAAVTVVINTKGPAEVSRGRFVVTAEAVGSAERINLLGAKKTNAAVANVSIIEEIVDINAEESARIRREKLDVGRAKNTELLFSTRRIAVAASKTASAFASVPNLEEFAEVRERRFVIEVKKTDIVFKTRRIVAVASSIAGARGSAVAAVRIAVESRNAAVAHGPRNRRRK